MLEYFFSPDTPGVEDEVLFGAGRTFKRVRRVLKRGIRLPEVEGAASVFLVTGDGFFITSLPLTLLAARVP